MFKKKKGLLVGILALAAAICMLFAACGGSGKIKFSFDTGDGPKVETVEVEAGQEYTLPIPEWEGYSFEGWYENAQFTGAKVTTATAEADKTFYAKWEQLYAITLQLGGGTLAGGTTKLYAKAGTNIQTFMQDYIPTYADHQFGEWLVGSAPLSADATLTAAGVTLTAHYKVAYTAELHLQKLTLDGYEDATETYHGFGYAGEQPAPEKAGFEVDAENENTTKKALSETASENNDYVLYMNRKEIRLNLMANLDDPMLGGADSKTITKPYGTEIELPVPFDVEGYCLVGWSTEPRGEVKYRSSYMGSILYNGTLPSDPFTFEETTNLYAVWAKGYVDLFGGEDLIFHLTSDAPAIYLLRGGKLFAGQFMQSTNTFLFSKQSGGTMLQGKLNEDGTFCISDQSRALTYIYYKNNDTAPNTNYTIILDNENGIKYVDATRPVRDQESEGTYTVDENGFYHVTYTEGPEAGNEYLYALYANSSRGNVFLVRDEEEFGWGAIPHAVVSGGRLIADDSVTITLNGFGIALFNTGSSASNYSYLREDDKITLLGALQMTMGELYLTEVNGKLAFLLYSSSYDHTFNAEEGEATFTLDGISEATYTNAEGTAKGLYRPFTSELGTLMLFFPEKGDPKIFMTYTQTVTIPAEDEGQPTQETRYLFREVLVTYSETQYYQDGYIYYSPLVTFDEKAAGEATVYGYVSATQSYVKALTGTYELNEETQRYTFTTKEIVADETTTFSSPVDIFALKSFTFSVDTVYTSDGAAASVMYWHSMTVKGAEEGQDETTTYGKTYTGDGVTLTVTQGFAIFTPSEGEPLHGTVTTGTNGVTIFQENNTNGAIYYFRLDDEQNTLTMLDGLIGTAARYGDTRERLTFDGMGNATYTVVTTAEDNTSTTTTYEGKYADTKTTTAFGSTIYSFTNETAPEKNFTFILLTSSSSVYFAVYNTEINGEYTMDGGATLTLDGFGFRAEYFDEDGNVHAGNYSVSGDVIRLASTADSRYYYFDLKEGKTFTVRDEAYGLYIYMTNQTATGLGFEFDGYGKLTVIDLNAETEEEGIICDDGGYEKQENGSYVLTYTDGAEDVTLTGWLGTVAVGSSALNTFEQEYKEVIMSFVNEADWSVLVLDGHGYATKYDVSGSTEEGQYVLVTDTMLYYANADGTDAAIYLYDTEKGTATPVKNTQRAYFSENFDALLFSQYGFMIMNGETRYYYNVGSDGQVSLYRRPHEGETADVNKYGFIEDNFFGTFGDIYTAEDGTKYYRSDSFTLRFTRDTADKTKYPVTMIEQDQTEHKYALESLEFSPSGSAEFTDSNAYVTINEHEYSCTVQRVLEADEKYHMYIVMPTAGIANFVFEIGLTYKGEEADNSYTISSMRTETVLQDMVYITYFLNYMMQGYLINNSFGVITLTTPFDEAGDAGTPTASGVFGETLKEAGLTYTNGEVISFTDVPYTTERNSYSVTFEDDDGYEYSLHFALDSTYYNYFGLVGYGINAFTRHQKFETTNDLTLSVERILFTESMSYSVGGFWNISLSDAEGNELESDAAYIYEGKIYYFVRTTDEETKKITSSTLYIIELKQKTSETVGEEVDPLAPYESATVTEKQLTVTYCEDGNDYVEYDATQHDFVFMRKGRTLYIFVGENCSYDAETNTFTLTSSSATTKTTFTVTFTEEGDATTATITESVEEIEPEQGEENEAA